MTTPSDPFTAVLDTQRAAVETMADATRRGRLAPDRVVKMETVDVGQTPSTVVYTENKLELLHYESRTDEQNAVPLLVVYALINRPYILDLQPDRSVVRRLLDAGHDVYLIDWNEPSRLDQHLTLSDYIDRYIDNCVEVVRDRSERGSVNLLGYCMGGTMSAVYTALYPEKVNALGLMAAGLCFDGSGGVLERWGSEQNYDPRDVVETFGNAPADMLDVGFAMMDPVENYLGKYATLYDRLDDEEFVETFARMERWLGDSIDVAGETYAEFLETFYQENALYRNSLDIGGREVDIEAIQLPLLQVVGEYDHLIPAAASKPFNEVVGTDDVTTIEHSVGHIGLSVSSSSHEQVWPAVADWYHRVSEPDEPASEPRVTDGPGETALDTGGPDVETVEGIGPTYAERLRAAGIETTADLAGVDVSRLAEITETGETRVEGWLDEL